MASTFYFEEVLYPPNKDGRADKTKPGNTLEIFVSNFYGDHQIFLRFTDENNKEMDLHLTKNQALELAEALGGTVSYIGYDNT